MRQLGQQLGTSINHLFPLVEAQPGTDVSKATVAKLERTRAVVSSVTARLAAITAPPAVRDAHRRLLRGLTSFSGELDRLISVLEHGTSKPFGVYTQFRSLRTIAKARDDIEARGYAIG